MIEQEWRTADKSAWGTGPWQDEPDKKQWTDQATGLPCLIKRNPTGALCGYVGVPEGHPWHRADYNDVEPHPEVHGGLTYADHCAQGSDAETICHIPEPGEPDNVWWLGFDCAHWRDISPAYRSLYADAGIPQSVGETYKTIAYVTAECASLAEQAAEAGRPQLLTSQQVHEEFGHHPKALTWWARAGGVTRIVGQDGRARYDRTVFVAFRDLTAGKTLLTQTDVAALFLTSTKTVAIWEQDGHLTRLPSRPGGGFPRYDAVEVHAFLGEISPTETLLTPAAAAALVGVEPKTLLSFADFGSLAYVRTPGGHHRYPETAVRALADTRRSTR